MERRRLGGGEPGWALELRSHEVDGVAAAARRRETRRETQRRHARRRPREPRGAQARGWMICGWG